MRLNPKSIANFFLDLAESSGKKIDPMKLQKLIYYAHGWYAGNTGEPLINETVEAWTYGPVIQSIYHEFKQFGSGYIRGRATELVGDELKEVDRPQSPEMQQFLRSVWSSYGDYSGIQLSEMTHAPGSPWDQTREKWKGMRGVDIPFDFIRDHFKVSVEKAKAQSAAARG